MSEVQDRKCNRRWPRATLCLMSHAGHAVERWRRMPHAPAPRMYAFREDPKKGAGNPRSGQRETGY